MQVVLGSYKSLMFRVICQTYLYTKLSDLNFFMTLKTTTILQKQNKIYKEMNELDKLSRRAAFELNLFEF